MSVTPFNEIWSDFKLQPCQEEYWYCENRFIANNSDRRTGKSELARRRLIEAAAKEPFTEYFLLMPNQRQANVIFNIFVENLPYDFARFTISKNQSYVKVNTSNIYFVGCDKLDRYEGMTLDGVVVDESSDILPGIVDRVIMPMLMHRFGFLHRIGVLVEDRIGYKEYKKFMNFPDVTKFKWSVNQICSNV